MHTVPLNLTANCQHSNAGTRDVVRPLPGDMGMQRVTDVIPRIVMVAAGAAHTSCITDRGVVLAWRSADPQAVAREVGGLLTGKQAVHISAGMLHLVRLCLFVRFAFDDFECESHLVICA